MPVAKRRAIAAKAMDKLAKKGHLVSPVRLEGRTIAKTFWGKAWCDNLESYSDYENRLPRGRTYVRNGSVVDLQLAKGKITALVSGSELYKIAIDIKAFDKDRWKRVQSDCGGKIDSLIELLQGRFSAGVMEIVTHRDKGLFPKPAEISMDCSCPDSAGLCKHLAAVLYGVGARLDEKPELLFLLRGVDPAELISKVTAGQAIEQTGVAKDQPAIADSELADVFGIDVEVPAQKPSPIPAKKPAKRKISKKKVVKSDRKKKSVV